MLLLLCFCTSAYGAVLERLRADLGAAASPDRAGVAIGFIGPTAETILFAGKAPFDETTLFEYGSLTKVLTATLLAELADEGTVELTGSVNKYLPEDVKHEKWRGVTLRTLATHTAGLPRLPPNMNLFYTLRHGQNPTRRMTRRCFLTR